MARMAAGARNGLEEKPESRRDESAPAHPFESGRTSGAGETAGEQFGRNERNDDRGQNMRRGENGRNTDAAKNGKARTNEIGKEQRLAVAGRQRVNHAEDETERQDRGDRRPVAISGKHRELIANRMVYPALCPAQPVHHAVVGQRR